MTYADRHAGSRGPEQQKQSAYFQIPRERGDPSAANEQGAYEEGPEEADGRECTQPFQTRPKGGQLWNDLYVNIMAHTPKAPIQLVLLDEFWWSFIHSHRSRAIRSIMVMDDYEQAHCVRSVFHADVITS